MQVRHRHIADWNTGWYLERGALGRKTGSSCRALPITGIAGVTLGGDHSILSRQYGLTLDHLLDIKMVNADGRVLHANANQLADLFWASRGCGPHPPDACRSRQSRFPR
jgi:hypothetical protein